MKRTDNEVRNEIGVLLSDSNDWLSDKCSLNWNLLIISGNSIPRNICMSFTKYVEVVENSAIMKMLPAKVTV